MQNKPNSRSSRPRYGKAVDAGSRHAEKRGPRWIGAHTGPESDRRTRIGTTRVQRVPSEEGRMAEAEWRMAEATMSPLPSAELQKPLLFSTARPSTAGEKWVGYKLGRAVVSRPARPLRPRVSQSPIVGESRGELR